MIFLVALFCILIKRAEDDTMSLAWEKWVSYAQVRQCLRAHATVSDRLEYDLWASEKLLLGRSLKSLKRRIFANWYMIAKQNILEDRLVRDGLKNKVHVILGP